MTKRTALLLGFIIAKFVLQYFLISPEYDLQRDEYLHLDQADHLAWGYMSIPPVTSWISTIISFLGNSVFWVKFFPALFGALTIVVVWKTIEELNGQVYSLILGSTCVLFSALLRLNTLYQPNSLDVLSWTALYYFIIKYINTDKSKWLYIAAATFAIGFLNKYNIAFALIGLLPAIIISEHRNLFTQKRFYFAILLGLVLISPNLIWQYNNGFPVFNHLRELSETQLVHVSRWNFVKGQLLFFAGSIFVIFSAMYALLFYAPYKKYKVFFWSILFTLSVFIFLRAKDYYAIGLYPVYLAFGSVYLESVLLGTWKKYLGLVLIALPILFFIPMSQVFFPNKSPQYILEHAQPYADLGLLRWEDGEDHALPQDFADMLGWKELAEKVDSICLTMANLDQTLILCDNYGQAGAINYYTKNNKVVASSFHGDYLDWINLDSKIIDVILVKEMDDDDKERSTEIPLFEEVYLATKRINELAREKEISIYVLKGAKVDVNKRILEEKDRIRNIN